MTTLHMLWGEMLISSTLFELFPRGEFTQESRTDLLKIYELHKSFETVEWALCVFHCPWFAAPIALFSLYTLQI